MILDKIVESKRLQLEEEKKIISVAGWIQKMKDTDMHTVIDFYNKIKNSKEVSIIAEIKKASPSKGIIREDFNPLEIAMEYTKSGVDAISILTERDFFKGHDDYLVKVRQKAAVPILRKDFIIDLWQIYQSRYLGADVILLIAAILNDEELKKFQIVANILGLHCLVEVHDKNELDRVLDTGAKIIGINNRNLNTFETDIKTTEKLMNYIPEDKIVISESGINSKADMDYLRSLGVDGVLIGETFMRAASISEKIKELRAC